MSRKKSEDLKDGERSLRRAKSGETLVEDRSFIDVRIVRYASGIGVEDQSNNLAAGSSRSVCVRSMKLKGNFWSDVAHVHRHSVRFDTWTVVMKMSMEMKIPTRVVDKQIAQPTSPPPVTEKDGTAVTVFFVV